ncbi:MAG: hybrid sensor histidine kinase/response regulator, partial [Acidimicrobiales bacterium]
AVVTASQLVASRAGTGAESVTRQSLPVGVSAYALPATPGRRGWIAAPIVDTTGEVRRVVVAVGEGGVPFSLEDESVLTVFAQMASVALRNARLYGTVVGNERRLQTVVDSSPVAIAELDRSGEARWWNQSAATLFGWGDGSPPRIPVRAGSELVLGDLLESCFRGKGIVGVTMPVIGTGGTPLELSVSTSPLGPPDAVAGALVVAEDVTGRQRMLEELHQAERLQAMSRMAGALAHDFNNLLTVILGCGERLMRHLGEDDELGRDATAIHRAGTRAAALTSQLVRIGGQRHPVQAEAVCLDEVVVSMKPMLAGVLGEQVHLHVSPGAGESTVLVDPSELERCVLNLVINARDAMPHGGTCTVETGRRHVDQSSAQVVELRVTDDGVGMDEDTVAHCFEPFFTTKGRARGTGLGLSGVHAFASQAGGDVRVTSSPGVGTTFTIRLLIASGAPAAVSLTRVRAKRRRTARRETAGTLLVVDDEVEVLRLEVRELEAAGFEVLAAGNASEALQRLDARGHIELLVTDVVMPGMSGIELAAAVRTRQSEVPVLFVSGHLDDDVAADATLPANSTLLAKPFSPDELSRLARAMVRGDGDRARGVGKHFALAGGRNAQGSKR